jgi:hypothetical protein
MRKKNGVPRWVQFFLPLLFLSTLLLPNSLFCADVTLAWDPNSEADLEGYGIYFRQGAAGPPYNLAGYVTVDELDFANAPSFTVTGLQEGSQYYFAATAFNTGGKESAYSVPVCAEIAAGGGVSVCSASVPDPPTPPPTDDGPSTGSSSGGGGGGGGCFISCAAAGPAGATVAWIPTLAISGGIAGLLSLRLRRSRQKKKAGG